MAYRKLEVRSRTYKKREAPGAVVSALTGKCFVIDRLQSVDWRCGVVSKLPLNMARVVGSSCATNLNFGPYSKTQRAGSSHILAELRHFASI